MDFPPETEKENSGEAGDRDILCGIGRFKPKWLQVFNNAKAMCLLMTIYAFTHGFIANGVFNINTTSFERRFHLSSFQAGWISSANDVSAATLGILISFFGAGRYKARWISLGIAVTAIGCLLMGLPHFLTGQYQWGQNDERVCRKDDQICSDDDSNSELPNYLFLLMAGHFLNGVSGSTLLTVGISYIDDSIPSKSSPLYSGIVQAMLYVGVGVGYVLGGLALNLYVDFDKVPKDEWVLTTEDPRWVGAWWLSFFLAAVVYVILCLIFLLYGSELPSAKKIREDHEKEYKDIKNQTVDEPAAECIAAETHEIAQVTNESTSHNANANKAVVDKDGKVLANGQDACVHASYEENYLSKMDKTTDKQKTSTGHKINKTDCKDVKKISYKNFFPTLFVLLKSPTFVFLCLAYSCSFMGITSFAIFMAKTIQFQYNQIPSMAAILAGVILIPGAVVGNFLGGFIIQKFNLQVKGDLIVAIITSAASVPLTFIFFFYCKKLDVAGWNVPYDENSSNRTSMNGLNFHSPCNENCNCRADLYEPVCDQDMKQYFSPCFAGCTTVNSSSEQIYSNCSCLLSDNSTRTVSAASCHYGCTKLYYVLAVLFLCLMLMTCIFIPIQTVILSTDEGTQAIMDNICGSYRIHSDLDKTFSLGIMWMFARVLGAIPGPIILGAIIDSTCIVWGKGCHDDSKSSCWIYDSQLYGRNIFLFSTTVNFGATVFLVLAFLSYQYSKKKQNSQTLPKIELPEENHIETTTESIRL